MNCVCLRQGALICVQHKDYNYNIQHIKQPMFNSSIMLNMYIKWGISIVSPLLLIPSRALAIYPFKSSQSEFGDTR